jgi:diaminobutyrate-2-oxoglutarate transaminase
MFPGPTGTNAVEAALKLARKVTGRNHVISFTNGFHGMTLGSLALTGNGGKRKGAGVPLEHVSHMPFDGFLGEGVNTVDVLRRYLEDTSSGLEKPAAFILETLQGEGGVQVASKQWLQDLAALARRHRILLIVDDIQVGCGRTGSFFSFEDTGVVPDIVTLSKSLSGFGLPFAITLFKPELDVWNPGEHNGTFRGHNPAFVTATTALDFWADDKLSQEVMDKGQLMEQGLKRIAERFPELELEIRGKGLIWGLDFGDSDLAGRISAEAFKKGLVIETSGSRDQVLKMLPPLTIGANQLKAGLGIIGQCLRELRVAETNPELAHA